ncbi:hypothetical protein EJ08DRAFT_651001, partial [Tothia fuscella]
MGMATHGFRWCGCRGWGRAVGLWWTASRGLIDGGWIDGKGDRRILRWRCSCGPLRCNIHSKDAHLFRHVHTLMSSSALGLSAVATFSACILS